MLLWDFNMHKAEGKTLDIRVIDLVKSEKCCGMILVSLSWVYELKHFMLKPCSLELVQLTTFILVIYSKLKTKYDATKQRFNGVCNHINANF